MKSAKNYAVSDPAFYDPLIAEQKERAGKRPGDAKEWLELGRLCEEKIDMIQYVAKRQFILRHFLLFFLLMTAGLFLSFHFLAVKLPTNSIFFFVNCMGIFIVSVALAHLWFLRYPMVNSLTLGQCHFVLKLTLEGEYALKDYGDFLDWLCATSGTIVGKRFVDKLGIVVKQYRNTIAHQSPMNKEEYEHLRDLIFADEEALLIVAATL